MLRFFVDSDSDITLKEAKQYGADFISMPYEARGELIYPYIDFEDYDDKAFMNMLRSGVLPTTSALNEEEYINHFEPVFANGDDIIYVHFSRNMTASFDNMDNALKRLKEKYPERKFYEVDTKGITLCSYFTLIECLEMYKAGKSPEEIVEYGTKLADKCATYFFSDDLKFFRKSGRVGGFAGIMGNLIGIKPIIYMDDNGKMTNIGKVKGTKNAVKALIEYFDKLKAPDFKDHRILIGHGDAPELVEKIVEELKAKYGEDCKIQILPINPTAGSHCGPETVGISFYAIHR